MASVTRRLFAGSIGAAVLRGAETDMPRRRLGKIPFEAGILGIGTQHLGDRGATQDNANRVVAEAIDAGVNYFDTAPTYNLSEERLGVALKGRRDRVFLVSKVETNARGDVMYQIRDSLHKLQTDYLDCVHIHNVGREDRFPSLRQMLAGDGTLGALLEARKQGLIRYIGATCHMRPARAIPVLETGSIDLFMCTINYVERHIYKFEEQVLPEARKRNIAVIGMKVLGGPAAGGARLSNPDAYSAALRYAWSTPGVAASIVGLRTPQELRKAVQHAREFRQAPPDELQSYLSRGRELAAAWGPLRGPVA